MIRRLILLIICFFVVACEEESAVTPTPEPPQPTAIALNPPQVWIDQPLPGQAYTLEELPAEIIAHAASVGGNAQLQITANGVLATTVDLGAPLETLTQGGNLNRYQGLWLPFIQELLLESTGNLVLEIRVVVSGVESDPIIITILKETATPTPSATDTPTDIPTDTLTPTDTATDELTATDVPTDTPDVTEPATDEPTATPTERPTATPTEAPTLTFTPTATNTDTPTPTPTPLEGIGFVPKDTQPCQFIPVRDRDVAARVGPGENRASLQFIKAPTVYDVTGFNSDTGSLWWEFDLTSANRKAWVADTDVYTRGSCMLVPYVEAPDIIRRPPPTRANPGNVTPNGSNPVIYYFYADHYLLPDPATETECTYIHWKVEFVDAVYLILNGSAQGVAGDSNHYVCPTATLLAELAIYKNGIEVERQSLVIDYGTITVTRPPRTRVPTTTPPTSVPPTSVPPAFIEYFYPDNYNLGGSYPSCANIYWSVLYADSIYYYLSNYEYGEYVGSSGTKTFCPGSSGTFNFYLYAYQNGILYDTRSFSIYSTIIGLEE